jgi:hypothetical protein
MKKILIILLGLTCLLRMGSQAQTVKIDWAGTASPGSTNAIGSPDDIIVAGAANTSTFGGFGVGAGNTSTYNYNSLATLLNLSNPALLAQADFIAFEGNGTPNITFETGTWTFTDGTNNFAVTHTFGNTPAQDTAGVLALGNISVSNYNAFFGATNVPAQGDLAYILFDIPSSVNLASSSFGVSLVSPGDTTGPGTPDMDALGRLSIPEPSSLTLSTVGLLLLPVGRRIWRRLQGQMS